MSTIAEAHILPKALVRDLEELQPAGEIDWQTGAGETFVGGRNPGYIGYAGNASGHWLLNGSGKTRKFTVGYPGQWVSKDFGIPIDNQWRYEGSPGPGYDRHIQIVEEDGSVWSGIDFKENPLQGNFFGIKWGPGHFWYTDKLAPGQLRGDYRSGTAGGFSLPAYSMLVDGRPGCVGILVHDYQKVSVFGEATDGLLDVGPKLGEKMILPKTSKYYDMFMDMGGKAAEQAEHMATYGCMPVDRSGYADILGHQDKIGKQPKQSVFWIQTGGQWRNTNIADFTFPLSELRYGVPVDIATPVEPEPPVIKENPRIQIITEASNVFSNTIIDNTILGDSQREMVRLIRQASDLAKENLLD